MTKEMTGRTIFKEIICLRTLKALPLGQLLIDLHCSVYLLFQVFTQKDNFFRFLLFVSGVLVKSLVTLSLISWTFQLFLWSSYTSFFCSVATFQSPSWISLLLPYLSLPGSCGDCHLAYSVVFLSNSNAIVPELPSLSSFGSMSSTTWQSQSVYLL